MAFAPRFGPRKSSLEVGSAAERDLLSPPHGKQVITDVVGPAPSVYNATDSGVIWVNSRPLWIHGVLGKGGFGTVFKVEMLVPFGCKVGRDADGGLIFNEEGFVAVYCSDHPRATVDASTEMASIPALPLVSGGGASASGAARGHADCSDEDLRKQALELSEPPPKSISYFQLVDEDASVGGVRSSSEKTPGAKFFFPVESLSAREQDWSKIPGEEIIFPDSGILVHEIALQSRAGVATNADQQDDGDGVVVTARNSHAGAAPGADEEGLEDDNDIFAMTSNDRLFGSGAFFALKIQAAKSKKQLEDFAKEADNFRKLRGSANVVQIRDHTVMYSTLHLMILMELGACDLLDFLKRFKFSLSVADVSRIWGALLRGVVAAHQKDIIHRDLKPQNFLLVPMESPFADRILATTSTPLEKFEFRLLDEHDDCGDVALALRDSWTGHEVVLRLVIKLSDFGLAQPLELEESHLSVQGQAGTLKYMAPETLQPTTEDCRRQLSKRVDIWALGMMLFQMLHDGRTPFDSFFKKGDIEAVVAISSKVVHQDVVKFERAKVWAAERQKVEQGHSGNGNATTSSRAPNPMISSKSRDKDMVSARLRTELLFRMCERCLAFEVADRAEASDFIRWVDDFGDSENREEKISVYLLNGNPCVNVETLVSVPDEMEAFFPKELRRCVAIGAPDIVGNAVIGASSPVVQNEAAIRLSIPSAGRDGESLRRSSAVDANIVGKGQVRSSASDAKYEELGSVGRLSRFSAGREGESLHVRRSSMAIRFSVDNDVVGKAQGRPSISVATLEGASLRVSQPLAGREGEASPLILHRISAGCISGDRHAQVLSKGSSSGENASSGKTRANQRKGWSSSRMFYVIVGIVVIIILAAGFTLVGLHFRRLAESVSVSPGISPTDFLAPVVSHDAPKSKPSGESSSSPAPAPVAVPVDPTSPTIRPSGEGVAQPAASSASHVSTSSPARATRTPRSTLGESSPAPVPDPVSVDPTPRPTIRPSGEGVVQPATSASHVSTLATRTSPSAPGESSPAPVPAILPSGVSTSTSSLATQRLRSEPMWSASEPSLLFLQLRQHQRHHVAFAAGILKEENSTGGECEKAVKSLIAHAALLDEEGKKDVREAVLVRLKDQRIAVRLAAIDSLARLGLTKDLKEEDMLAGVIEAVSDCLVESVSADVIEAGVVDKQWCVRTAAIDALAQLPTKPNGVAMKKAALALSRHLAKFPFRRMNPLETIQVIETLGRLFEKDSVAVDSWEVGHIAIIAVSNCLGDAYNLVRYEAMQALEKFGDKHRAEVIAAVSARIDFAKTISRLEKTKCRYVVWKNGYCDLEVPVTILHERVGLPLGLIFNLLLDRRNTTC